MLCVLRTEYVWTNQTTAIEACHMCEYQAFRVFQSWRPTGEQYRERDDGWSSAVGQCGQQRHGWAQSGPGAVLAHCDHRGVRWLWSGLSTHTHTDTQYYTSRLCECVCLCSFITTLTFTVWVFWPSAGHEVNVASLYLGCVYFKMHPNNTAHNLLTGSFWRLLF